MNWADGILIAAFAISILIGVLRGFTREVLGLVAWVIAIVAALMFGTAAALQFESHIETPSLRLAAGYAAVFFGVLVLGAVVTSLAAMLVRKSPLSGVDRMVGGGYGLLRGVMVGVLLVWLAGMTPARHDPWWAQSALIPPLDRLARSFEGLLPESWRRQIEPMAAAGQPEGV